MISKSMALALFALAAPSAMAADSVTMTWTDSTGAYQSMVLLEVPTLADVKTAYQARNATMPPPPGQPAAPATPAEFYDDLTKRLANEVANYAQQYKHQQAVAAVPPVVVSGADPKTGKALPPKPPPVSTTAPPTTPTPPNPTTAAPASK